MGRMFIRQLDGRRRVVKLDGRAGPKAGVDWGVRQRGQHTWYSGSAIASVNNQGPEELPTEFEFKWRTRTLVNGEANVDGAPVTDAYKLVGVFEEMLREGILVSVDTGPYEKIGTIREFHAVEGRRGEFVCTLEMDWAKNGGSVSFARRLLSGFAGTLNTIRSKWNDALRIARAPATIARNALEDAQAAVGLVNEAFRRGQATIDTYGSLVQETGETVGDGVATLTSIARDALDVERAIDLPAAVIAQTDDAAAVIGATLYRASVQRAARQARHGAVIDLQLLQGDADPDVLGVHQAVAGEDLRRIAFRYYNDAGMWEEIATFNKLTGSLVAKGGRIRLPRRGIAA